MQDFIVAFRNYEGENFYEYFCQHNLYKFYLRIKRFYEIVSFHLY